MTIEWTEKQSDALIVAAMTVLAQGCRRGKMRDAEMVVESIYEIVNGVSALTPERQARFLFKVGGIMCDYASSLDDPAIVESAYCVDGTLFECASRIYPEMLGSLS